MAAENRRVADLEVVGLCLDAQQDRLQRLRVEEDQVGGAWDVEEVREGVDLEGALAVVHLSVRHEAAVVDVEGTDARMDDPAGAGVAPLVRHSTAALEVLVDAEIHLGLAGAGVEEVRARRTLVAVQGIGRASGRDAAGEGLALGASAGSRTEGMAIQRNRPLGAGVGIRVEVAGRELPREPLARRAGDSEIRAVVVSVPVGLGHAVLAVEQSSVQGQGVPHVLPRRLRDDVHHSGQGVGAPHGRGGAAHDLDLLDLAHVGGNQVPQDEAEEVEVDRTAVEEGELRVRQGRSSTAGSSG